LTSRRSDVLGWAREQAAYIALVLLVVVFWALAGPNFVSARNWTFIVEQVSILAVLAVAQTFVITAGFIDLSMGSVLGLACFTAAWGFQSHGLLGLPIGILTGLAIGVLNGAIFAYFRIPSFIVTLATMVAVRAAIQIVSGGQAIYLDLTSAGGGALAWLQPLGRFPGILVVTIVIVAACWVIYNKTPFGQDLKAMGGDERVVGLFGISLNRRRLLALFVGTVVGIASIMNLARVSAATPVTGVGLELLAISAVVLGGTPLTGGYGSVAKTVVGALALVVLSSGLTLTGVPPSWNDLARGAILIIAIGVALDRSKIGMVK